MSEYCPEGVREFSFEKAGSKGKFQPAELGSGPNTTNSGSGGAAKPKMASGGASATPAGVKQNSGTEAYTSVTHKNASHGGPAKKSGAGATPADVRHFGSSKP